MDFCQVRLSQSNLYNQARHALLPIEQQLGNYIYILLSSIEIAGNCSPSGSRRHSALSFSIFLGLTIHTQIRHKTIKGATYQALANYSQKITYYSILLFSDIEPIILSKVVHHLKLFSTWNTLCAVLSCMQYKNDVKFLIQTRFGNCTASSLTVVYSPPKSTW